jgi:hypothetical protein
VLLCLVYSRILLVFAPCYLAYLFVCSCALLLLNLASSCALLFSCLTLLTLTPCCYCTLVVFVPCCFHALLVHALLFSRLTTPCFAFLPYSCTLLHCFHTLLLHVLLRCYCALLFFVIAPCCCCALLHDAFTFAPCCPVVNALPSRLDAHHFQVPPGPPHCCSIVLLFAFTPCFFALLVGTPSSFSCASGRTWNNTKLHPTIGFSFS